MNIPDEKLSAFLDRELSAEEMQAIREALATDPGLVDRLASLAAVDEQVRSQAEAIDSIPMPDSLTRLLEPDHADNVIRPSRWNRWVQPLREHVALAASIALVTGMAVGYLGNEGISSNGDSAYPLAVLDSVSSGNEIHLEDGSLFVSRFTFLDQQDRYCRQFAVRGEQGSTENIACRSGSGDGRREDRREGNWTLMATVFASTTSQEGEYQPATAASMLDSALDLMMKGEALSIEDEAELIRQQW